MFRISMHAGAIAAMICGALIVAGPAQAEKIGSVAALNSDVDGTPPDADKRQLFIGEKVVQNELIESSPIGSGQLLFLDQTTLTVARNSTLTLDRYVYDPDKRTGQIAMSMSKGVLRFIGGRITKKTDAVIVTPTATIGIRGGMAIITVDPDGTTRAMHIAGEYTRVTTSEGEEMVITRSNGVAEAPAGVNAIGFLGVADADYIRRLSTELIGRGEAGERVRPLNPDVVTSGILVRNSEAKGVVETPPLSTTGESAETEEDVETFIPIIRTEEEVATVVVEESTPPGELLPGVTGSAAVSNTGIPGLTTGAGSTFTFDQVFEGSRIGLTADDETVSVPTPAPGFFTFALGEGQSPLGPLSGSGFFDPDAEFTYAAVEGEGGLTGYFLAGTPSGAPVAAPDGAVTARRYDVSDDLLLGGAPFLPSALGDFSADGGSDLILISQEAGGATGGSARAIYAYLDIAGEGPGQRAGFGAFSGLVDDGGTGSPSVGSFFQGFFTDGLGGETEVAAAVANESDGRGGTAFGPGAQYLALGNRGDFGLGVETLASSATDEAGAVTLYGSSNVAALSLEEDVAASSRNPLGTALSGFAAAVAVDGGDGPYAISNAEPEEVTLTLTPGQNSASAAFQLGDVVTPPTVSGGGANSGNASGSLTGGGTSLTINSTPALNRLGFAFGGTDGESGYLDDQTFAMRASTTGGAINGDAALQSGALATAGMVGDGGVFPTGVDTTPEFLTWGWWGASLTLDDDESAIPAELAEQNLPLGTWIAGVLTDGEDLPDNGVATYDGFATVSATQGGATFVDGAGFNMSFDFGLGVGTVSFTDLLDDNPVVSVTRDGDRYAGVAGANPLGQAGLIAVDGAFFNAGSTAGGATAGDLAVLTNNGALQGAGVFGGDRTSIVFDE